MRPPPQMVIPAQPVYMAPAPQFAPAPMGMPMHPPGAPMHPPGAHPGPPGAHPGPPRPQHFEPPEEPPSKKMKSGEDNLMPEADFLARNVSPVTFRYVYYFFITKPKFREIVFQKCFFFGKSAKVASFF